MELKLCAIIITNQWLACIATLALNDNQLAVHSIVHWFETAKTRLWCEEIKTVQEEYCS